MTHLLHSLLHRAYHRWLCPDCDGGAVLVNVNGRHHHLAPPPRRRSLASVLRRA